MEVNPASLDADAGMWQAVSSTVGNLSEASVRLDERQLSFASRDGLAAAYVAMVERFSMLMGKGSEETTSIATELREAAAGYRRTDASSAHRLMASGQGLGG